MWSLRKIVSSQNLLHNFFYVLKIINQIFSFLKVYRSFLGSRPSVFLLLGVPCRFLPWTGLPLPATWYDTRGPQTRGDYTGVTIFRTRSDRPLPEAGQTLVSHQR